jgi:thiamine pyrophosphokinase
MHKTKARKIYLYSTFFRIFAAIKLVTIQGARYKVQGAKYRVQSAKRKKTVINTFTFDCLFN